MDVFKSFKTDQRAETQGRDFQIGDATVTMRRAGGRNDAYGRRLRELLEEYRARYGEDLPWHVEMDLFGTLYAETILVAWSGVEIDGEPVDIMRAAEIFKEAPDFLVALMDLNTGHEAFLARALEDAAGN